MKYNDNKYNWVVINQRNVETVFKLIPEIEALTVMMSQTHNILSNTLQKLVLTIV